MGVARCARGGAFVPDAEDYGWISLVKAGVTGISLRAGGGGGCLEMYE